MQLVTPQDAHRTQNMGVVLSIYLDEFRVWLYQNKLHLKRRSPYSARHYMQLVKGGLAVDGKFYSWHIYRCTMALTNMHSDLIYNALSVTLVCESFILHLGIFSVHFILCFFYSQNTLVFPWECLQKILKTHTFPLKTHLVVSAGEFLNKQGHFCKWILVFH